MRYDPTPEDQLNQRTLLAEGEGTFEVLKAEDKISKAGNEMIELLLKVWDKDGKQSTIFDYLVSNQQWKILHFFKSTGSVKDYLEGDLDPQNLIGTGGKLKIAVKKDPQYGDQNKVADYLEGGATAKQSTEEVHPSTSNDDDSIPF